MNLNNLEAERHEKESRIRLAIERHNDLELAFRTVENECDERDVLAARLREDIETEIKNVRDTLKKISSVIERIERERALISKEFRKIVKADMQKRLEKRLDNVKYEDYISRDELYRLIQRYKKN